MLGQDDVAGKDFKENQNKEAHGNENILRDGGAVFDCQRLADGSEGGFSKVFINMDSHPFGRMGLLFFTECDLIKILLVVLDESIQADSKFGDEHMFSELKATGG
jgi:hypothetical protein